MSTWSKSINTASGTSRRAGVVDSSAQAYQALTYEEKWKSHVDKEWEAYKTEWEVEHPDEKRPPKNRFQIMVEFMKDKYKNETDEMKARCEEYRQARKASPAESASEAERNL